MEFSIKKSVTLELNEAELRILREIVNCAIAHLPDRNILESRGAASSLQVLGMADQLKFWAGRVLD